jgi:hypothetical protein
VHLSLDTRGVLFFARSARHGHYTNRAEPHARHQSSGRHCKAAKLKVQAERRNKEGFLGFARDRNRVAKRLRSE